MVDVLTLTYFREIARFEHVGRAAESLRVAQPSLSRSLARLEKELGVPLFDRVGRRIRLNTWGRTYLAHAEAALRAIDDGAHAVRQAAGLERGQVRVASETLLTVARLAGEFRTEHPDVELTLRQADGTEMQHLLAAGEVDVCLASVRLSGPELVHREVHREPVLLAVPPGHRLTARRSVSMQDLAGEAFVSQRHGHWPRALLDRLVERTEEGPRIVCESDEPGVTLDLVAAGIGMALVPDMARRAAGTRPRVEWLEVRDPQCERVLVATTRDGAFRSAAADAFVAHAAQFWTDSPERRR